MCVARARGRGGTETRESQRRDESRYFVFWFQRAETSVQDAVESAAQRLALRAARVGWSDCSVPSEGLATRHAGRRGPRAAFNGAGAGPAGARACCQWARARGPAAARQLQVTVQVESCMAAL